MPYNSSTGVMSGAISHSDLRNMLGVAYKTNRELCRATSVNPKSRYKPVEYAASTGPLGESQFKEADWGYRVPEVITQTEFRNYIVNGTVPTKWQSPESTAVNMGYGWYYIKPSTWHRLRDFNGYNHKTSGSLLGEMSCSSVQGTTLTIWYYAGIFNIGEFNAMQGMHFGVAILTPNNTLYFKTTQGAIDSGASGQIVLSSSEKSQIFSTNGTYKIYAIATASNEDVTNQLTAFVALPAEMLSVSYTAGGTEPTKSVYIRLDNVSADWVTIYVENRGTTSVTVNDLYIGVYTTDGAGNPSHREQRYGPISLTAAAGTTSSSTIDISEAYVGADMEMGVKIETYSNAPSHWNIDYTFHTFIS